MRLTVLLIIAALSYVTDTILTAARAHVDSVDVPAPVQERAHLPSKCAPYYNDGTDRWKDCMGVGYK